MSIEESLATIAKTLVYIAQAITPPQGQAQDAAAPAAPAVAPVTETVAAPAPVLVQPTPVVVPPTPLPDPAGITTAAEFMTYVMDSFKSLGANGNRIQEVLIANGVQNINEVQPAQWAAIRAGIEALK